ncbi:phospho-sugar mutase [Micrococcales bacterium 31B]|nr:phospho-sugar mutase [Micrococcales bacterium 31B]
MAISESGPTLPSTPGSEEANAAPGASAPPSPSVSAALREEVEQWIAADPDELTRDELTNLLDKADGGDPAAAEDLEDRFAGFLQFGTAGLRGEVAAGPNRMNRAVVIRAASGLAAFLREGLGAEETPRIVIGYDARRKSDEFARDTAAVMTAAGVEALLLPSALPTPVLAFGVKYLHADAGVMVTASHNPPNDNGYKVYLGGRMVDGDGQGAQIVEPYDRMIAAKIAAVTSAADVDLASGGWEVLDTDLHEVYMDEVAAVADDDSPRDLRIVYTAMHGVGGETAREVLHRAGFTDFHPVPEQFDPDPLFSTVAFPNPEEPGAIDLSLALAQRVDADIVIANDPDADRCAAAVYDPALGRWRMLHGDEIGALIGSYLAGPKRERLDHDCAGDDPVFANSIVSSRLLGKIAAASGITHYETLTGFKWIARSHNLSYGYEEAIGYCVAPHLVRDKDGVSTAVLLAEIAAELKERELSPLDMLDCIAELHGVHLTDQVSIRVTDLSIIAEKMAAFRTTPPASLAGSPVVDSLDLLQGSVETTGLPPTDGLVWLTADDTRVIARPSGTEPKLKCYVEVIEPVRDADVSAARAAARERMESLKAELTRQLG